MHQGPPPFFLSSRSRDQRRVWDGVELHLYHSCLVHRKFSSLSDSDSRGRVHTTNRTKRWHRTGAANGGFSWLRRARARKGTVTSAGCSAPIVRPILGIFLAEGCCGFCGDRVMIEAFTHRADPPALQPEYNPFQIWYDEEDALSPTDDAPPPNSFPHTKNGWVKEKGEKAMKRGRWGSTSKWQIRKERTGRSC
jgi:hypothetical protein